MLIMPLTALTMEFLYFDITCINYILSHYKLNILKSSEIVRSKIKLELNLSNK